MTTSRTTYRKAVYAALLLSVVGLAVVCGLIVGPQSTAKSAILWLPQIATGYACMILAIEYAGMPLRSHLTRYWVAAPFGLALFVTGVITGSATSMLVYHDFDPLSYIVKPLYWMTMFGFIPALLIGCIFCAILRRLAKSNPNHQTTGIIDPTA